MPSLTLLDIAQRDGCEKVIDGLKAIGRTAPEVTTTASRTIKGTSYSVSICTSLPRVGFRDANSGSKGVKSKYVKKNVECFIMSENIICDKAVVDGSEDGKGVELARETRNVMSGAVLSLGMQYFYGHDWDPKGFPGLPKLMGDYMTLSANPDKNVDNAANRADSSGSSVYLIYTGDDGVQFIYGNGQGLSLSSVREQLVTLPDGTNMDAYYATLKARPGLTVNNKFAVARIKNISKDHPLTDSLIAEALSLFPAGVKPTMLFVNPTTRLQLQKSRTLVPTEGSGGTTMIAPMPTESFGVKIVCTDSLLDDEKKSSITAAKNDYFEAKKRATLKN